MDRSELFIVTHTRKDGVPVNSECAVAIVSVNAFHLYLCVKMFYFLPPNYVFK
ncbi:hypothetical protein Taro_056484 [Colocasia esculenta]|uniref:Uncharacterized protein n=1 Tax=Colocasia esculenta TaxID=4460 RepID=A0A843XWT7_COLES|nr:hypothetical protein [Colocasia esculenta]